MHAAKFIQHMKTNADRMCDSVTQRVRNSNRCSELTIRVPVAEQRRCNLEIYRDLIDWLAADTDAIIEKQYVALGMRRAQQGVPLSQLFWAVCIAREHLWDHMQQECLIEEPVEFWGGVNLLHSLNQFFDRALYFTLRGYQRANNDVLAGALATFEPR